MRNTKLKSIIEELVSLKKEGVYWDFKREFHHNIDSLVHDIICLANADYSDERYLIFGVTNSFDFLCIKIDKHRKIQAQIIDTLRSAKFANDVFPDILIESLDYGGKCIDVLIIANSHNKPYYLTEDKGFIRAGTIYTRVMDTNTPRNKVAPYHCIEKMWKERFGLIQTPLDRFKYYIKEYLNWINVPDFKSNTTIYYRHFPEFTIQYLPAEHNIDAHLEWARGSIGYLSEYGNNTSVIQFCYYNTPISYILCVNFDGGKKYIIAPKWESICNGRIYYYLEDSMEYIYQKFFLKEEIRRDDSKGLNYTNEYECGNKTFDIPVFTNESELYEFKDYVINQMCPDYDIKDFQPISESCQNKLFYNLVDLYSSFKAHNEDSNG